MQAMNFLEHQNSRIEAGEYIRDRAKKAVWNCAREDAAIYFVARVAEAKKQYSLMQAMKVNTNFLTCYFFGPSLSKLLPFFPYPPQLRCRSRRRPPTWPLPKRRPVGQQRSSPREMARRAEPSPSCSR